MSRLCVPMEVDFPVQRGQGVVTHRQGTARRSGRRALPRGAIEKRPSGSYNFGGGCGVMLDPQNQSRHLNQAHVTCGSHLRLVTSTRHLPATASPPSWSAFLAGLIVVGAHQLLRRATRCPGVFSNGDRYSAATAASPVPLPTAMALRSDQPGSYHVGPTVIRSARLEFSMALPHSTYTHTMLTTPSYSVSVCLPCGGNLSGVLGCPSGARSPQSAITSFVP